MQVYCPIVGIYMGVASSFRIYLNCISIFNCTHLSIRVFLNLHIIFIALIYNQNAWFKIFYTNLLKILAQVFMFCLVNNYFFLFFCKIVRFFVKLLCQNHILMQIECILDKPKIISLFLYNSNNYLINKDHNTIYTNCDCVVYQYKPLHYNADVSCLQYLQLKED